jgi:hypothetical protein
MLPPGHTAAGFLVAKTLLAITHPALSTTQLNTLLVAGAFFGFAPDLDMFYAFLKARGFTIPGKKINHRAFITHRPFVWLVAGLLISLLANSPFWTYFGLLVWLGSWSHFILDSHFVGVMWLWPFSHNFYAVKNPGQREENNTKGFFNYWFTFLTKVYPKVSPPTFYTEILLLLIAAYILLR